MTYRIMKFSEAYLHNYPGKNDFSHKSFKEILLNRCYQELRGNIQGTGNEAKSQKSTVLSFQIAVLIDSKKAAETGIRTRHMHCHCEG